MLGLNSAFLVDLYDSCGRAASLSAYRLYLDSYQNRILVVSNILLSFTFSISDDGVSNLRQGDDDV